MTEVAFVDESNTVRLRGRLEPPPGGSQPELIEITVTAAELIAAWTPEVAALEVADIKAGDLILWYWEDGSTLDQNVHCDTLYAFTTGASSEDVNDGGEGIQITNVSWASGTYADTESEATLFFGRCRPGAVCYLFFTGDSMPTEGSTTVTIAVLRAP